MKISAAVNEALNLQRTISEQLLAENLMPDKIAAILKAFAVSSDSDSVALYATIDEN